MLKIGLPNRRTIKTGIGGGPRAFRSPLIVNPALVTPHIWYICHGIGFNRSIVGKWDGARIHIHQSTHCLWHVHRSQSRVERVVTGLDISISVRAFGYNKSSSDKDQIQRVVMRILGTKHCECVGVWRHSIRYHDYVVILFRFQYWMCCVTALNESRLFRWIRDVEILIKIALFVWE